MTDNFKILSNDIANEFLQSVVFIDDRAYISADGTDSQHDFDAQAITRSFAENKKICAVLQPIQIDDIALFSNIAQKSDVTVLDWQIVLSDTDNSTSDEEDDDQDDIRGVYTKAIIGSLLGSPNDLNSLKLIIVYTGDVELIRIAESILEHLQDKGISGFVIPDEDKCCVISSSCKILIRAKSNGGKGRGQHYPAIADMQVSYEELPRFINEEFSKMTDGLLSNFALQSLTSIRNNSFQILKIFSKKLDSAYLAHQSLLPNTGDANELLVDLLGDTITSILRAKNLGTAISSDVVEKWIEQYIAEENKPLLTNKGSFHDSHNFLRSKKILKDLLVSSPNIQQKFVDILGGVSISKTNVEKNYKNYAFSLFHREDDDETVNMEFSKLCQHKDLIKFDNHSPVLALGTVVRSSVSQQYYVCIQQRCDATRVGVDEARRFLFLTLVFVENGSTFHMLTPTGEKLKLDKQTYGIKTIRFSGSEVCGSVRAMQFSENGDSPKKVIEEHKKYFIPSYHSETMPEKFEFIFELKDLYAQRVVAEYSSSLSRVGLDEPEWIRLS